MDDPESDSQPPYGSFDPLGESSKKERMPPPWTLRDYLPEWLRSRQEKLKSILSGFASWVCLLSGILVVCEVVVVVPALLGLDIGSRAYLSRIGLLSWQKFLANLGTTQFGFISAPSVSIASGIVAIFIIFATRGLSAMLEHWRQNIAIVFASVVIAYSAVYGSSYLKNFLNEINSQQVANIQSLEADGNTNQKLKDQIAGLQNQVNDLSENIYTSEPIFSNIIYFQQAFHSFESGTRITAGNMCLIRFTGTKENWGFVFALAELANKSANCPMQLVQPGADPDLDKIAAKGIVDDKVVFHMVRDDRAANQLFTDLFNYLPLQRSYDDVGNGANAHYVWLQFGRDAKWTHEQFKSYAQ